MAGSWLNTGLDYLMKIPIVLLTGYVVLQWKVWIILIGGILIVYSIAMNISAVLFDSEKVPRSAFPLLMFFDFWLLLSKLTNWFGLDPKYGRSCLDWLMLQDGKPCKTTVVSIEKVNDDCEVYVNRPAKISSKGCLVYIHGGGWTVLSAKSYNTSISWMAHYLEMVVVSVEYRLAPEDPFPAGLTDCYNALQWVYDNKGSLDIDADKVFVGGDSAGGNLTAAVSLLHRDRKGAPLEADSKTHPALAGQILIYPCVQAYTTFEGSMVENSSYFPPRSGMSAIISKYCAKNENYKFVLGRPNLLPKIPKFWYDVHLQKPAPSDKVLKEAPALESPDKETSYEVLAGNYYIFPLHAENLSNVAPAYTIVATADTLKTEGTWYADYLKKFGVRSELSVVRHVHGFMGQFNVNRAARDELMKVKEFMEDILQ